MTRQESLQLLREHVKNENMVKHCLAAEAVLSALAERGLITPDYRAGMSNQLRAGRDALGRFVNSVLGD